jgi:hypothetical protein
MEPAHLYWHLAGKLVHVSDRIVRRIEGTTGITLNRAFACSWRSRVSLSESPSLSLRVSLSLPLSLSFFFFFLITNGPRPVYRKKKSNERGANKGRKVGGECREGREERKEKEVSEDGGRRVPEHACERTREISRRQRNTPKGPRRALREEAETRRRHNKQLRRGEERRGGYAGYTSTVQSVIGNTATF